MLTGIGTAQVAMKRARDTAKTEFDRMECDRMDQFLTKLAAVEKDTNKRAELLARQVRDIRERADLEEGVGYGDGLKLQADEIPPVIRRRLPDGSVGPAEPLFPTLLELTGTLLHLDCSLPAPIMRLTGDQGETLELEIRDPKQVNVQMTRTGEPVKELELTCGEQSKKVKVGYLPPSGDRTRGELRSIQYR